MLVKEIIEGYNESVSFTNQIGTFTISPERVKYTLLRNKYYQIAKEVYDQYVSDWAHYQHCNSNRVICKENGEPYRPKSFTRKWAETLKKYGLRHIKLHGTRHSAISLLLSEGVPIQIAQQRAGHQDPKITLSVYSHVSKDKESLVADMLEDVLFSAVGE